MPIHFCSYLVLFISLPFPRTSPLVFCTTHPSSKWVAHEEILYMKGLLYDRRNYFCNALNNLVEQVLVLGYYISSKFWYYRLHRCRALYFVYFAVFPLVDVSLSQLKSETHSGRQWTVNLWLNLINNFTKIKTKLGIVHRTNGYKRKLRIITILVLLLVCRFYCQKNKEQMRKKKKWIEQVK